MLAILNPNVDPDELLAEGYEDVARGNEKIARAIRMRKTSPSADPWVPLQARKLVPGYSAKGRAILDAGKRGELEIGRIGRMPAARKSSIDAWVASRSVRVTAPSSSSEDENEEAFAAAARRAGGAR